MEQSNTDFFMEQLYMKYAPALKKKALISYHLSQQAAEDLTQNTFLTAIKYQEKLSKKDIRVAERFLYTALHNHFRNHLRTKKNKEVPTYIDLDYILYAEDDYVTDYEHYLQLINSLPPKYAEVLKLSVSGYRNSEIAELLEVAEPTIRSRISRARAKLRKLIEKNGG